MSSLWVPPTGTATPVRGSGHRGTNPGGMAVARLRRRVLPAGCLHSGLRRVPVHRYSFEREGGPLPTDPSLTDFADLADRLDFKVAGRSESTVLRLVEAAAELLEERGEQGFRIADLRAMTGISTGSLYHHFGSREGLIKAARAYQYAQVVPRDGHAIALLAVHARSAREFVDQLTSVIRTAQSAERAYGRLKQAEFLGTAVGRPDVFAALRSFHTDGMTASEQIAEVLIQRGWVRAGISPRALVMFTEALVFGRIVGDLDLTPIDPEEWVHVVRLATAALFNVDDVDDVHD
jgi:AcrR family transcriptional regulator